jgi:hypothetical protein
MKAAPGMAEYVRYGALLETGPKISPSRMIGLQETEKVQTETKRERLSGFSALSDVRDKRQHRDQY